MAILDNKLKKKHKKRYVERGNKFRKHAESGKYEGGIIKKGDGDEKLAHELGHVENRMGNNIFDRRLNRSRPSIRRWADKGSNSFWRAIKSGVNLVTERMEEVRASKRGLKLLKKAGATKEELEVGKEKSRSCRENLRVSRK